MFDPALAAELGEYRAALSRRVKDAVAAADRAVDEWVWTSGEALRWSPFLYERERHNLPAEKILRAPEATLRGHANGYSDGQLRLVRCFDTIRAGTEYLREPDGDRTWWAEIDAGAVVGVGLLESTEGRLECVTSVRGSREIAWQWHQERYTWHDERLALIERSGAEMQEGGKTVEREYRADLTVAHTAEGELEAIFTTRPSGGRMYVYQRPERELGPDEFRAQLTRAVVEACQLGLSRRDDVAIAYLAYLPYRTFPPDLLIITRDEIDEILADEDHEIHDVAPAEWGSAELLLPYAELGVDQWQLAARVKEAEREALALAALEQAAEELAAELPDVVVLAIDYESEDDQLADALDRVLRADAPLRALL
jgi:hypothetical protein